jgi:biotin operon repressor
MVLSSIKAFSEAISKDIERLSRKGNTILSNINKTDKNSEEGMPPY